MQEGADPSDDALRLDPGQTERLLAAYGIAMVGVDASDADPSASVEVVAGVVQDPAFGPVLVFGLGGLQVIVTPIAVLGPNRSRDGLTLISHHGGTSVQDVEERTGFETRAVVPAAAPVDLVLARRAAVR